MNKISMATAYISLVDLVEDHGVCVWDTAICGPGGAVMLKRGKKGRCLIIIDGNLSYKKRFFILLHEVGHLFYYLDQDDHEELVPRKSSAGEQMANQTAVKILRSFKKYHGIGLIRQFVAFYNGANKNNPRRAKFIVD